MRISANPIAGFAQRAGGALGHRAVAARANVEHICSATPDTCDRTFQNFFWCLPVVIIPRIRPRVIRGVNTLPQAVDVLMRNFHVAQRPVIAKPVAGPARHERIRLVLSDYCDKLFNILFGDAARSIKPDNGYRPVFVGDFLYLRTALVFIVILEISVLAVFGLCRPSAPPGNVQSWL